jgi:hypothetical protein
LNIDGLAFAQAAVIGIGNLFRAFLGTGTAGDALVHIHESRVLSQADLKVTLLTGNAVHFGQCQ